MLWFAAYTFPDLIKCFPEYTNGPRNIDVSLYHDRQIFILIFLISFLIRFDHGESLLGKNE